jgi:gliding motility-associated-like protein
VSYAWSFGDGNHSTLRSPTHHYTAADTYRVTLTVVDSVGCVHTIEHGPYIVRKPELNIVNVFTPNGDGINDTWKPFYDGTRSYRATLFDRWGIRISEFTHLDSGWNGTVGGSPAAAGTYFYTVEINGRLIQGSLTLIR